MPERSRQDQVPAVLRHRHDLRRLTTTRLRWAAAALIGGLAAFWFYLSAASVSSAVESGNLGTVVLVAVGLASAVNLVALVLAAIAAYYLPQGKTVYFWFVIVVLVANVLATLADQFGLVDTIYLLGSLVAIGLTIALRRRSLRQLRGEPAQ